MVNIVENWSEVFGKIKSLELSNEKTYNLILEVEKISTVKSFPSLIKTNSGEELSIQTRGSDVEKLSLKKGDKIKGIVKVVSLNNYYFRPGSIDLIS